jgi:hypothetical protein
MIPEFIRIDSYELVLFWQGVWIGPVLTGDTSKARPQSGVGVRTSRTVGRYHTP